MGFGVSGFGGVRGFGFGVSRFGVLEVWGSGFSRYGVSGSGFQGLEVRGFVLGVRDSRLGVSRFRVRGLGFGVSRFGGFEVRVFRDCG